MENINEQKIARSKKTKDKVVIKFKTQKNIKKPKIKGKHGTIYKLCLPKMFNLAPMEDEYFHSSMAGKLPEGIRANVVTLPTLQSQGLKMKETILLFICK